VARVAAPDAVALAYVHGTSVSHSWHSSVLNLLNHDAGSAQRIIRGGWIAFRYGTGGIVEARNRTAAQFLESDTPWLFWIDTDMGFAPETVDRLASQAHETHRPIVGALCFAQRETGTDGMGGFHTKPVPTLYDWHTNPDGTSGFVPRWDYERDSMQRVAATGSACLVIHRSVFEAISEHYGPGQWYTPMTNPTTGQHISEDLAFCARAEVVGKPVHVHTGVKTSHDKSIWLSEDQYLMHRAHEAVTA
jgi:hypothetical protein